MKRVLFVSGRNKLRSTTAEQIFGSRPRVETASAGLNPDAETVLDAEMVEWADIIFTMDKTQRAKLIGRFRPWLGGKRVIALDIPDRFAFMDPELVRLLEAKVTPHLR